MMWNLKDLTGEQRKQIAVATEKINTTKTDAEIAVVVLAAASIITAFFVGPIALMGIPLSIAYPLEASEKNRILSSEIRGKC